MESQMNVSHAGLTMKNQSTTLTPIYRIPDEEEALIRSAIEAMIGQVLEYAETIETLSFVHGVKLGQSNEEVVSDTLLIETSIATLNDYFDQINELQWQRLTQRYEDLPKANTADDAQIHAVRITPHVYDTVQAIGQKMEANGFSIRYGKRKGEYSVRVLGTIALFYAAERIKLRSKDTNGTN